MVAQRGFARLRVAVPEQGSSPPSGQDGYTSRCISRFVLVDTATLQLLWPGTERLFFHLIFSDCDVKFPVKFPVEFRTDANIRNMLEPLKLISTSSFKVLLRMRRRTNQMRRCFSCLCFSLRVHFTGPACRLCPRAHSGTGGGPTECPCGTRRPRSPVSSAE